MLHAAARQGTGALLPLTPAYHRPAGTPTPTLPTIAKECWDQSMSTGHSSHGFSLSSKLLPWRKDSLKIHIQQRTNVKHVSNKSSSFGYSSPANIISQIC